MDKIPSGDEAHTFQMSRPYPALEKKYLDF